MDIIVDPRFRDKIPKPSEEELRTLEDNILADGVVRDPLVLWAGKNILVDGHNRWDIIQRHPQIPYSTTERRFDTEEDVIIWICRNQRGRRNISKVVYDKLIQEEYEAMTRKTGGDHKSERFRNQSGENPHLDDKTPKTRRIIAEENGITEQAVRSAVEFGRGLDRADDIVPGFKDEILSGSTKAKKADISDMRKMEPEQIKEAVEEIRNPKSKVAFPTGQTGKSKTVSQAELDVEIADSKKTAAHAKVEYGIEDLLEDLRMLQEDFINKYHNAIDLHMDVATDNGKQVLAVMKEFDAEWREVKERVK